MDEQRAIVLVLGALDDKIDLNRRMNQTLDSSVSAMFAFRFTKIDAGTQYSTVQELAAIQKTSINPADHKTELFNHYSIPSFDENKRPRLESGIAIKSNKFLVPEGAILLSKLNPRIPRVWLPTLDEEVRSICSTEFLVITPTRPQDKAFLYSLFISPEFFREYASKTTGTSGSHQRVRPDDLLSMKISASTPELRAHFGEVVDPLLSKIAQNREESQTLAALRDTLLPKLLSGEIRIKQAEQIVENAV